MNGTNGVMTDPIAAMLAQVSLRTTLFAPSSRYYGLDSDTIVSGGRLVRFLLRRFVPPPERFTPLQEHAVMQHDRLDVLAARYLGDPVLFWRLCDANRAMRPQELTETVGRKLRIPLPDGLGGGQP